MDKTEKTNRNESNLEARETEIDESRRALLGFGAASAGALLLSACIPEAEDVGEVGEDLLQGVDGLTSYQAIRDFTPVPSGQASDHVVLFARGRSASGDGGEGFFFWDAAETRADNSGSILKPSTNPATGRWKRGSLARFDSAVHVDDFGALGDNSTDDSAAIGSAFDYALGLAKPVKLVFSPGKNYKVTTTIDAELPDSSVVEAWGSKITCTHDGVAFDMNKPATDLIPNAQNATPKRNITWLGGQIVNTNATKSSSVAIQSYMMTGFTVDRLLIGDPAGNGFKAGFKFAGQDTYHFIDCHVRGCVRGWWVPGPDVVFDDASNGNDLQDVELRGCHSTHSNGVTQAGFYSENRINNLKLNGGSFNGECSIAHVRLLDNSVQECRGFYSFGVHYEQIAGGTAAILFESVLNGPGHVGVLFLNNRFSAGSGANGWQGVKLARCQDVQFRSNHFIDGSGGSTEQGIYVDNNSRRIRIDEENLFENFATGQAIVLQSTANRRYVTLEPEICSANQPTGDDAPVVLTNYNWTAKSTTGDTTLTMAPVLDSPLTKFLLPPRGYFVNIGVRDSGSAAAGVDTCWAKLRKPGVSVDFAITAECQKKSNDSKGYASGYVTADNSGQLTFSCNATGSGTLDVFIAVTAVRQ